jgi:hypothetical protein
MTSIKTLIKQRAAKYGGIFVYRIVLDVILEMVLKLPSNNRPITMAMEGLVVEKTNLAYDDVKLVMCPWLGIRLINVRRRDLEKFLSGFKVKS